MAKSEEASSGPVRLPELPGAGASTAHEYAYRRLRHALMVGSIAPGVAITIRRIAGEFGISATPVREALRRLESENALQMLDNRRIRVPEMTRERFEDLTELRAVLESHAARRALPHLNQVLIDQFERIDDELDAAMSRRERSSTVILNQRFHSSIYATNPRQVVMPMIESLWLQLGPFLGLATRHLDRVELVDHHKKMIAAMRIGDEIALLASLRDDIDDSLKLTHSPGFDGFRRETGI